MSNGINISLDSLDAGQYAGLTGGGQLSVVLEALERAAAARVNVKVNAVLLEETQDQILPLARLAGRFPVDVRFIELMPIGYGTTLKGLTEEAALAVLRRAYPDLAATEERRGNGPASYYRSGQLQGRIGFIAANTHGFCSSCNRLRLTADGMLKPCLHSDSEIQVRGLQGEALKAAFEAAIMAKPAENGEMSASMPSRAGRSMNRIGG